MATAKKSSAAKSAARNKKANSGKNTVKKANTGKRSQAVGQAAAAAQFRSLGVGLMLIGLMLALWFLVIWFGVFFKQPTVAQALANCLSGPLNVAAALFLVYFGYGMYSSRRGKYDGWQVAGWCFFLFALAAMLHMPYFADGGILAAMKAALAGFGGGVCGFLAALPVCWMQSPTASYIALIAFFLLGLMLGTDMRIFAFVRDMLKKAGDSSARAVAEHKARAAEQTAVEAKEPVQQPARRKFITEREEQISLPPVVTDYSGRRFAEIPVSDYHKVTVGDMMGDDLAQSGFGARAAGVSMPGNAVPAAFAAAPGIEKANEPLAAAYTPEKVESADTADAIDAVDAVDAVQDADNAQSAESVESPGAVGPEQADTAEPQKEEAAHVRTELRRVVNYQLPPISLMKGGITVRNSRINQRIMDDSTALENVLASFGVKTKVVEVVCGPSIIRYELQPAPGVKISKIVSLSDDIALALAARGLRIEAPVPGKSVVGIEIARDETSPVYFKDVLASENFRKSSSAISIALGVDINGNAIVGDLAEMPHLLIAGATGSGKSVCMNTLICSILYKARPDEVKFIMVDPKKVELTGYVGLPHLGRPVVTDPKKASQVLKEVVNEMERRYLVFVNAGVKNFKTYNQLPDVNKMPHIVVLIDELADLMMVASHDVEDAICRLAQMARAAGIHLVIATQRPSVDVITGLIKANIPSRIAFAVSSQIDSRTILDMGGAEKLLGKGDMLYFPIGRQKPLRVQGAFLTEEEIQTLVEYCKQQAEPEYLELPVIEEEKQEDAEQEKNQMDELFIDACQQVLTSGQASASSLQRRFRIGYNRAARLIETMQEMGIVSAPEGNKRTILMSMEAFAAAYMHNEASPHSADRQEDAAEDVQTADDAGEQTDE